MSTETGREDSRKDIKFKKFAKGVDLTLAGLLPLAIITLLLLLLSKFVRANSNIAILFMFSLAILYGIRNIFKSKH